MYRGRRSATRVQESVTWKGNIRVAGDMEKQVSTEV